MRNLDMASLRSFVHTADTGSVSRAAHRLNLTQSATSMQIKRLETSVGSQLFNRGTGGMTLTLPGEQMLTYARSIIDLNDTAYNRLTASEHAGLVRVGLPTDICTLIFPDALRAFHAEFPRAQVAIDTSLTPMLKTAFDAGKYDIIITTEHELGTGGTALRTEELVWTGLPGGQAYKKRPLPIGVSRHCAFRSAMVAALDRAGINWFDVRSTDEINPFQVELLADLCVDAELESVAKARNQVLDHGGSLPSLPSFSIGMMHNASSHLVESFCAHIIQAYK